MLPVKNVQKKKYNYYMSDHEVRILLAVARSFSYKWYALCSLMAFRGLRINEALHVKTEDFNDDYSKLDIILCKSHIFDTFPIPSKLQKILKHYCKTYYWSFHNGFLFSKYTGKSELGNMSKQSACAMFSKIRKRAIEWGHLSFDDGFLMKNGNKRHRISNHALRRWHETRIYYKNHKDSVLLRDVMRYRKTTSIEPYVRSAQIYNDEQQILDQTFADIKV